MPRGILGKPTDPKNRVLYFLNHDEKWPSDDSNDEDFEEETTERNDEETERNDNSAGDDKKRKRAATAEPAAKKGRLVLKCRKVRRGNDSERSNKHVKWKMETRDDRDDDLAAAKSSGAGLEKGIGAAAAEGIESVGGAAAATEEEQVVPPAEGPWGKLLPPELLLRIFGYVIKEEGVFSFWQRASKVCVLWREVAKYSNLWSLVDLSFPKVRQVESELESLCEEGLAHTREMMLSGWKRQLTMTGIKFISENCPALSTINLSECTNVNCKAVKMLVDKCPRLSSIDLSHVSPAASADGAVTSEAIGYLMSKCGERLSHLNLTGNCVSDLQNLQSQESWFPVLTHLNLSACTKLNENILRVLADKCPSLNSIDLSHTSLNASTNSPCSSNSLRYLVSKCGSCLVHLNLSNNVMRTFSGIFTVLANSCHQLRVLDMSNVSNIDRSIIPIPVEKLQEGCPKLKVLRFANVRTLLSNTPLAAQATSPGFPELEELSIAVINQEYHHGLDDVSLERILKTSNKLKLLDVRGCSRITASGLVRLPAFDLEYLFLSQCPAAMTADIELVMEKWCHSLVEVDLSWNNHAGDVVDAAVKSLASSHSKSFLHSLNLSGSAVSHEPVKAVLKNCPNLSILDLSSCRGLPRGIKRLYKGEDLQKYKMEEDL